MVNSSEFLYQPPSENITSTTNLFQWLNASVENWFFPGILISIFFIILIKMLFNPSNTASKAFSTASFIVMILAVFCRVLDFINTGFMSIFVVLTLVGITWMYIEEKTVG